VPGAVAPLTSTVNVKTAGDVTPVQLTTPSVPTAGVVHVQPAATASETNVVLAGNVSVNVT